jgi:hypothetical protein
MFGSSKAIGVTTPGPFTSQVPVGMSMKAKPSAGASGLERRKSNSAQMPVGFVVAAIGPEDGCNSVLAGFGLRTREGLGRVRSD